MVTPVSSIHPPYVCLCWKNIFLRSTLFSSLSFFLLTFAGSPLTLFLLVQKAIFFVCCVVFFFFFFRREVLTSSHALFLPLSPRCSLFAPLSPLSPSQDETVGEVSLAFAGGLPRCLGDALR